MSKSTIGTFGLSMPPESKPSRGRPKLDPCKRRVRINVTLSPVVAAILDKSPLGRSGEIERLVLAALD